MFSFVYLLLAILAAATIPATAATPYASQRSMELGDIINNTVCGVDVQINEDLNRIPEHIQQIKCAQPPNQWCVKNGFTSVECCHGTKDQRSMECVEVTNRVLVNYKDREQPSWLDVPIGCVCLMSKITSAGGPANP